MSVPADFLPALEEELHAALNTYNKSDGIGDSLRQLHLYRQRQWEGLHNPRTVVNRLLQAGLSALHQEHPDYAAILRHRFVEEQSAQEVATRLRFAEGTIFKKQREGIESLAHIIRQQEWIAHCEAIDRCYERLEGTLTPQLFGIDGQIEQLTKELLLLQEPWLICIEGIGGIGKTTLADAVARTMLQRGEIGYGSLVGVGWVTARQSVLNGGGAIKTVPTPALTSESLVAQLLSQLFNLSSEIATISAPQKLNILQQRLKAQPHLIVIDNLETVADVEHLLDTIRLLANPSKFLLTSRQSLFFQPALAHWRLSELSAENSFALIHQQARLQNLPDLLRATTEVMRAIYTTVGGNPLAIKLLLGQLHTFALDEVLADLRHARGQKAEDLYAFIYRHIWEKLDDGKQRILLLMPLAAEQGADLEFLAAMAKSIGISVGQLHDGLAYLSALNLVESRGDLHQRRYVIHSLTRTFLQQDVLRWGVKNGQ